MSILIQPDKHSDWIPKKPISLSQVNHYNRIVFQEYIVFCLVGQTKQLVKLRIKDNDQENSELWQTVSDNNPRIYDPPNISHVGQHHENLKGNCCEHHIQIGERPCTSWEECKTNDQRTLEQVRENNKNVFRNVRRRKNYKDKARSEKQEQQHNHTKQTGFNFQEFAANAVFVLSVGIAIVVGLHHRNRGEDRHG